MDSARVESIAVETKVDSSVHFRPSWSENHERGTLFNNRDYLVGLWEREGELKVNRKPNTIRIKAEGCQKGQQGGMERGAHSVLKEGQKGVPKSRCSPCEACEADYDIRVVGMPEDWQRKGPDENNCSAVRRSVATFHSKSRLWVEKGIDRRLEFNFFASSSDFWPPVMPRFAPALVPWLHRVLQEPFLLLF
ncbi:hypothetical protein KM043_004424 [Ampulex compressa]|nr:hypothetical protein KM043_004424 [Ampulex compressa]